MIGDLLSCSLWCGSSKVSLGKVGSCHLMHGKLSRGHRTTIYDDGAKLRKQSILPCIPPKDYQLEVINATCKYHCME